MPPVSVNYFKEQQEADAGLAGGLLAPHSSQQQLSAAKKARRGSGAAVFTAASRVDMKVERASPRLGLATAAILCCSCVLTERLSVLCWMAACQCHWICTGSRLLLSPEKAAGLLLVLQPLLFWLQGAVPPQLVCAFAAQQLASAAAVPLQSR